MQAGDPRAGKTTVLEQLKLKFVADADHTVFFIEEESGWILIASIYNEATEQKL